jgi:two-component system chemotaxis response regulator CheB
MVVDDSAVARQAVVAAINRTEGLVSAGIAANGRVALDRLDLMQPDVMVLDLEMPELDGISTLHELRRSHPDLPVVVFSNLTSRGAAATLEALAAGASGFALKPTTMGDRADTLDAELMPLVIALGRRPRGMPERRQPSDQPHPRPRRTGPAAAVVVGVSTGGPAALTTMVVGLPGSLRAPVIIVQHMPPVFTRMLADRLNGQAAVPVSEATHGERVHPGHVYIAPGGHHLQLVRTGTLVELVLDDGPPVNSCRPAADVLFRSAAKAYGSDLLGIVLTGMGRDGTRGAEAIRAAGGSVIVQDPDTAVIGSMPSSVLAAGVCEAAIPIELMAAEIAARTGAARP